MKCLSTVIVNWNGRDDTLALLASLSRCRMPSGWTMETCVVDCASEDDSAERIQREYSDVTVLQLRENRRFAGGCNAGIERALASGADAIMVLNNDTEAEPGLIDELIPALESNPLAGAAGPLIYYAGTDRKIWYAGGATHLGLGLTLHHGYRSTDAGQYRDARADRTGHIPGCCLVAWREVWRRVGMFDESYFMYSEDADWCLRAAAAGYELLFVPRAHLWHKVSASSGASSRWKVYHRLRTQVRLFRSHARGLSRLTWLPSFLAIYLGYGAALLAQGKWSAAGAVPRALADSLQNRPPTAYPIPLEPKARG